MGRRIIVQNPRLAFYIDIKIAYRSVIHLQPELWEMKEMKWGRFVPKHCTEGNQLLVYSVFHERNPTHEIHKIVILTVEFLQLSVILLVQPLQKQKCCYLLLDTHSFKYPVEEMFYLCSLLAQMRESHL